MHKNRAISPQVRAAQRSRSVMALGLAAMALSSCGQPKSDEAPIRFEGVTAASGVTFNSSPSRCAISFLYDNFRLEWLESDAKDPKPQTRSIEIAAAPGAQGKPFLLDLRGAAAVPAGARLTVRVAEKIYDVPLKPDGDLEDFYHRVEAQLADGPEPTRIVIEATSPRPQPAKQVLLDVDSIDVGLPSGGACKSIEDEKQVMPPLASDGTTAPDPKIGKNGS